MNSIICVNSVISGEIGDNGTEIISVKLLTASVKYNDVGSSKTPPLRRSNSLQGRLLFMISFSSNRWERPRRRRRAYSRTVCP